jgi:hypothetical protein
MVHDHKWKGFALFGTVALAVAGLTLTASAAPLPKDTIITTFADNNASDQTAPQVVVLTKDGDPTDFAFVNPNPGNDRGWLAPIGIGPDGHVYLAIASQNGQLLDLTAGGDRSKDAPIAKGFLATLPHKMASMAFDAEGNVYIPLSEPEDGTLAGTPYPIYRIELKSGKVSTLKGTYNSARGLLITTDANKNEIMYIVEAGTGKILTYNLTTDTPGDKPFATGFPVILDHGMGILAFDKRTPAHLMLTYRMDPNDNTTGAVFDVSNGGDFSNFAKTPPILTGFSFTTDCNGFVFDSKNNMYIGGDNHFTFVSNYDATKGTWGDFNQYANDNGGGDCESLAIVP